MSPPPLSFCPSRCTTSQTVFFCYTEVENVASLSLLIHVSLGVGRRQTSNCATRISTVQVRGAPDGRGAVAQGMLACGCQRTGQCMMAGTWPIPAASACRCREACVGRNACCKGAAGVAAPHDAIPTSEHRQLKSAGTANGARRCRCRRTHAAAPAASDIGSLPSRPTDAAWQSSAVARRQQPRMPSAVCRSGPARPRATEELVTSPLDLQRSLLSNSAHSHQSRKQVQKT